MAILKILQENDEALRKKSRRVDDITPRIITLLDDMRETLAEAQGVGLAAPQVGVLRRIFIVDMGEEKGVTEFINPEIIETEGVVEDFEACLSCPGKYGVVKRPQKTTIRATDRNGEDFIYVGEEIYARAFCHEYDHLEGILYLDKAIEILNNEDDEDI